MEAPAELLEQEFARAESHNAYAKTRYRILKAKFSAPFRRTFANVDTVALGTEIDAQQAQATTRRAVDQKRGESLRRRAGDLGIRAHVENSERSASALELMAAARRQHKRQKDEVKE